jgi:dATP pyrophosphohydrolase
MQTFVTPPCITAYIIRLASDGPKYLLIRRCCGGYLNGTWQMVTGATDPGETAVQAALREIKEETGLSPTRFYTADAVETFFIHSRNKTLFVPVFVAFVDEQNVQLCPAEHDAYEWLSFEEAREKLVWTEQQRIIQHVQDRFVLREPNPLFALPTV